MFDDDLNQRKERRPRAEEAGGRFQYSHVHVGRVDCHHRLHRGVDAVAQPPDPAGRAVVRNTTSFKNFA